MTETHYRRAGKLMLAGAKNQSWKGKAMDEYEWLAVHSGVYLGIHKRRVLIVKCEMPKSSVLRQLLKFQGRSTTGLCEHAREVLGRYVAPEEIWIMD